MHWQNIENEAIELVVEARGDNVDDKVQFASDGK